MDLLELKKELMATPLSVESLKIVSDIFDAAIARGSLTAAEKEQIAHMLEAEEELVDIEISATQDAIAALDEYGKEVDAAVDVAVSAIEEATK